MKPLLSPLKYQTNANKEILEEYYFSGQNKGWTEVNIFNNFIVHLFVLFLNKIRVELANKSTLILFDGNFSRDAIEWGFFINST